MEIQILELKKIPKELRNSEGIINWMRFLGGKNRKELENMAKTDEYIDEAYRELQKLSSDERAKLEYEARQKAIRDYNSQMSSALKLGMEKGMEKGVQRGISIGEENKLREQIRKKLAKSQTVEEIADILEEDVETVRRLAAEIQSGE